LRTRLSLHGRRLALLGLVTGSVVGLQVANGNWASAYNYRYCSFYYGTSGNYSDYVKCYSDSGYSVPASVPDVNDIYDAANYSSSVNSYGDKPEQYWTSYAIGSSGYSGFSEFFTPGFAFVGTGHNVACSNISGSGHDCTWDNP
jgi:hypothetical protein